MIFHIDKIIIIKINEEGFWNKCNYNLKKFDLKKDVFFRMLNLQIKYNLQFVNRDGKLVSNQYSTFMLHQEQRLDYIDTQLRKTEEEVWPESGVGLSKKSYKIKYHFIDKERFDTVKMLAGHKFKKFRTTFCSYDNKLGI